MDEAVRQELIECASRGDRDALQKLLVIYHGPLSAAVDKRLDGTLQRHLDAEDVLQTAYANAFRTIGGCDFAHPRAFYKWLERIALNECHDQQRKLRARKRRGLPDAATPLTSVVDLADRLADPGGTPSRELARLESVAAVVTSLARLSESQRAVIRLRFLEGRSVRDVAAELGKSEAAIHMLCHRGLERLRTLLGSISKFLSSV